MRYELKLHRITFAILAIILIAFVLFLIPWRPGLADERLEVIASLAIVIVAATAFVSMGVIEGTMAFQFGRKRKRELLSYLLLGLFSLGCGLYLAILDSATVQTVALVAAPHAFLFGLAELRSVNIWSGTQATRQVSFFAALSKFSWEPSSSADGAFRMRRQQRYWLTLQSYPPCSSYLCSFTGINRVSRKAALTRHHSVTMITALKR